MNHFVTRVLKRKMIWVLAALVLSVFLFTLSCSSNADLPPELSAWEDKIPAHPDYNVDIKPILSDRCFKCHGPDKSKIEAGLQLVNFEEASKVLESGARAIDAGNIANSELVKRILSKDPEEVMPTPDSHLTLTDEEKALLIRWIKQGAEYKEHWSLMKIQKPEPPKAGKSIWARRGWKEDEETRWIKNEIDLFTLSKMKEKGLAPNVEADKTTLLRRIYMDITGLPPAPAEVEAFVRNNAPDAYEKVVDRLLQSSHYGEQQAVSWLDLARYADSHGYQDDGMRNVFPYRDWVINSFNKNLSFDKFILYQLAGDLMPDATRDMLIATSFNRQHAQTQEGGVVAQEYLTEYVADRTNTFGKAFLGLTMECARCHDHKYDPILAKDYYSLYAFFNQNWETGMIPYSGEAGPTIMLTTPRQQDTVHTLEAGINQLRPLLQPEKYKEKFEEWEKRNKLMPATGKGLLVHLPMEKETGEKAYLNLARKEYVVKMGGDPDRRPVVVKGKKGNALAFRGDAGMDIYVEGLDKIKGKLQSGKERFYKGLNFESNQEFSVSLWTRLQKDSVAGALFQRNNSEYEGWRGFSVKMNTDRTLTILFAYTWPANCIEVRTNEKVSIGNWDHLSLTYDGSSKASGIRFYINGKLTSNTVLNDNLQKSILYDDAGGNKYNPNVFEIAKEVRQKTISDIEMDEFMIHNRRLSSLEVMSLCGPDNAISLLSSLSPSKRTPQQQRLLWEHYMLTEDSTYASSKRQLTALLSKKVALLTMVPEVMIMKELPEAQSRKSYILKRGVYDAPGEEVHPETPLKLGKLPANTPRNRLSLAKWLLDENNPLFARVMVNRLWLQYFGNGLVKTQEDFGNQGEMPSHPELLDWLAVRFREDNWDVKKFVRRMVLSSTYRQSSRATAAAIENDPDNKWLARGSSYRYAAEQVRDNALAASGLLVRNVGGPSVYPYQPAGIWEALATRNVTSYRQQHGDSLYRRSMYTIWKRSSPPPMMLNFDVPDRSGCTVRRQKTATPLQALVTLNDPQFIEASRVLAERTFRSTGNHVKRMEHLFLAAISRKPRAAELALMNQLYDEELKAFTKDPAKAARVLATGEYPFDKTLDAPVIAAYAIVANTILNYDEAIIKR